MPEWDFAGSIARGYAMGRDIALRRRQERIDEQAEKERLEATEFKEAEFRHRGEREREEDFRYAKGVAAREQETHEAAKERERRRGREATEDYYKLQERGEAAKERERAEAARVHTREIENKRLGPYLESQGAAADYRKAQARAAGLGPTIRGIENKIFDLKADQEKEASSRPGWMRSILSGPGALGAKVLMESMDRGEDPISRQIKQLERRRAELLGERDDLKASPIDDSGRTPGYYDWRKKDAEKE